MSNSLHGAPNFSFQRGLNLDMDQGKCKKKSVAKRLTLVFRSFMFKGIRAKGLHGESDMFEMIVDLNLKKKTHCM